MDQLSELEGRWSYEVSLSYQNIYIACNYKCVQVISITPHCMVRDIT